MFDDNDILTKAKKIYQKGEFFYSFIEDDEFIWEYKFKRVTQKDIQKNYSQILNSIQKLQKSGLNIEYDTFAFNRLGTQKLPVRVQFNQDEFLKFIDKKDEFNKWQKVYEKVFLRFSKLKPLFLKKPFLLLEYDWDRLLKVVEYFLKQDLNQRYIRELDIKGIDTKFIEKHKKILDLAISVIKEIKPLTSLKEFSFEKRYGLKFQEELIRFRILDGDFCGVSDISLTLSEFQNLKLKQKRVFIVENLITALSFPNFRNSIVIFGKGYRVGILKDIKWLDEKEIIYWGDIDSDGFAILSQLRSYFSHTKSILMDCETIERFFELRVEHKNSYKDIKLTNLNESEKLAFDRVQNDYYAKNFRLEQERIPFWYLKEAIYG